MGVYKKNERKKELITKLQSALATGTIALAPHCTRLGSELAHCQWSETVEDKIVNASRWHLADALQYLLDNIPTNMLVEGPKKTFDQEMRDANTKRKEKEAQEKTIVQRSIVNRRKVWNINRR
jgi:nickel-dependent lactate racemase